MTPEELARIQQLARDAVVAELAAIAVEFDSDNPPDDVLDRFEALQARASDLDAAEAAATARQERMEAARASLEVMRKPVATPRPDDGTDHTLLKAFESYVRSGRPNADISDLRDTSPGSPGSFRAAQGEGVDAAGGYLVPDELRSRMVDRMKAFGGIMSAAEVITTSDGRTIEWPDLDDTANEGVQVAEHAAAASGADLAFTKHSITAYRFDSVGAGGLPLRVSRELLEDEMFDILAIIERKLPQRIMRHVAGKFITGTGSNEPEGLLNGLTGVELGDDTAGITYDDIVQRFIHSVDPAYRANGNCSWVMNDTTWGIIEAMKDAAGNPLWTNTAGGLAIGEGPPVPRLRGYPVVIDQACPDIVVADNTVNWGAFGDIFEGFVIRLVGSPAILVDPYTRISNNEIQYVANQRMDSIQNDTSAYSALTGETP